jgi:nicotinate-nucleotide pyrophosphorylase (carboxylating)
MPDRLIADRSQVEQDVSHALHEDVGAGDINAALIPAEQSGRAKIIVREACVLAGMAWANLCFKHFDPAASLTWRVEDGAEVAANAVIVDIEAQARALLTGERAALNFLQTLSATATQTARFATMIAHTKTKILDTRKTLPGLRYAQKYAVRCGGGVNHRFGLFDAFLLKENHIAAAGSIEAAVTRARLIAPDVLLEVEVETFDQLDQCLALGVKRVLLDNFSVADAKRAVDLIAGRIQLEASGGIGEADLVAYAEAGVDFISVGALTKHIRAIDLSMRFI